MGRESQVLFLISLMVIIGGCIGDERPPSTEGDGLPSTTPASTPESTLTLQENGEACQSNDACISGNCQNGICCLSGYLCCSSDSSCHPDQECSEERFYCVSKSQPAPTVALATPTSSPFCLEGMVLVTACVDSDAIDGYDDDTGVDGLKLVLDPIGGEGCVQKSFCIDKYEASRGSYGKAESKPGAQPWVNIDWDGAKTACEAAGKRLCKDWEWIAACNLDGARYYLTEEGYNEKYGCNTALPGIKNTGINAKCRSDVGVYDMIGNAFEWTDARVPDDSWSGSSVSVDEILGETKAKYGDDVLYRSNPLRGGNAFLRGGSASGYTGGTPGLGCFGLDLVHRPSKTSRDNGFRCCRNKAEG